MINIVEKSLRKTKDPVTKNEVYKVCLKANPLLRIVRRVIRDVVERGHPPLEILIMWFHRYGVRNMEKKYILPSEKNADITINTEDVGELKGLRPQFLELMEDASSELKSYFDREKGEQKFKAKYHSNLSLGDLQEIIYILIGLVNETGDFTTNKQAKIIFNLKREKRWHIPIIGKSRRGNLFDITPTDSSKFNCFLPFFGLVVNSNKGKEKKPENTREKIKSLDKSSLKDIWLRRIIAIAIWLGIPVSLSFVFILPKIYLMPKGLSGIAVLLASLNLVFYRSLYSDLLGSVYLFHKIKKQGLKNVWAEIKANWKAYFWVGTLQQSLALGLAYYYLTFQGATALELSVVIASTPVFVMVVSYIMRHMQKLSKDKFLMKYKVGFPKLWQWIAGVGITIGAILAMGGMAVITNFAKNQTVNLLLISLGTVLPSSLSIPNHILKAKTN